MSHRATHAAYWAMAMPCSDHTGKFPAYLGLAAAVSATDAVSS